jgi:hypothetical protein
MQHLLSSFFDHLNGNFSLEKMEPRGVLQKQKDADMIIKWMLIMHECKLYIH